jgi:DNA-binding Lrp family transcriptional regulator
MQAQSHRCSLKSCLCDRNYYEADNNLNLYSRRDDDHCVNTDRDDPADDLGIDWPLSRRLLATMMDASTPWLMQFDGDLDLAAVWQTIRLVNLSGETGRTALRPVPLRSVAASLGRPTTTTNARIMTLVAAGLCSRGRGGLCFAIPPARADAFAAASTNAIEVFNRLIMAMAAEHAEGNTAHAVGALEAVADRLTASPPILLEAHYVNYAMRVATTLATEHAAPGIDALIFNAIIGVHRREADAAVALRYSMPPESVRSLSMRLELPPETVRRRVKAMVAQGLLETGEGGVSVPEPARQGEQLASSARAIIQSFYQMQRGLAAALPLRQPLCRVQ